MNPDQIQTLISLFEQSLDKIRGLYTPVIEGIPVWELIHLHRIRQPQDWQHWLRQCGYAGIYRYTYMGRINSVAVHDIPGEQQVKFSCPHTLAIRQVGLNEIAVYQVDENKFLRAVIKAIQEKFIAFKDSVRACSKYVYYLGEGVLQGSTQFPVFLVRGMRIARQEILDTLKNERAVGLILYCGRFNAEQFRWPSGMHFRQLWEVLVLDQPAIPSVPSIDCLLFRGEKKQAQIAPTTQKKEVRDASGKVVCSYDPQLHLLSIPGKPAWTVTGDRAIAIVEYLVEQAMNGRWEISAKELLENTKPVAGGATQIPSIFKGKGNWEQYIQRSRRGYYRLNIEL